MCFFTLFSSVLFSDFLQCVKRIGYYTCVCTDIEILLHFTIVVQVYCIFVACWFGSELYWLVAKVNLITSIETGGRARAGLSRLGLTYSLPLFFAVLKEGDMVEESTAVPQKYIVKHRQTVLYLNCFLVTSPSTPGLSYSQPNTGVENVVDQHV